MKLACFSAVIVIFGHKKRTLTSGSWPAINLRGLCLRVNLYIVSLGHEKLHNHCHLNSQGLILDFVIGSVQKAYLLIFPVRQLKIFT